MLPYSWYLLIFFMRITGLGFLLCITFLSLADLCSNDYYVEATTETETCNCSTSVVVTSHRCSSSDTCTTATHPNDIVTAPFEGPTFLEEDHHGVLCQGRTLEMRLLQKDGQGESRVLPYMRPTLDELPGQTIPTALKTGLLGRSNFTVLEENTQATQQFGSEQGSWKGKSKGERQGQRQRTKERFCATAFAFSDDAFTRSPGECTFPCSITPGNAGASVGSERAPQCHQESIPRLSGDPAGDQGCHRKDRECGVQTIDTGSSPGHHEHGQSPKNAQGADGREGASQASMAPAFGRIAEKLATAARELRHQAVRVCRFNREGQAGHGGGACAHPDVECESRWKSCSATPRSNPSGHSQRHEPHQGSRRKEPQKEASWPIGRLCHKDGQKTQGKGNGNSHLVRRRARSKEREKAKIQISCSPRGASGIALWCTALCCNASCWELVIPGSAVSCLRKAERVPKASRSVWFDVNAYAADEQWCAANIRDVRYESLFNSLHPICEFHSVTDEDDYIGPFEALQRAQDLRQSCLEDSHDVSYPQDPGQSNGMAASSSFLPHVFDRWCAVDCIEVLPNPQDSPDDDTYEANKPKQIEWRTPDPLRSPFVDCLLHGLVTDDTTVLNHIITSNAEVRTAVFRTYGYFGSSRGQRDVRVPLDRIVFWKRFLSEAWADLVNVVDCESILVTPQPQEVGVDIHIIVTSKREVHGTLVLLQLSNDNDSPISTVVEMAEPATGYTLVRRAGHHIDFEADYRFRQETTLYYGSELLPVRMGQLWNVFVTSAVPDLHLQQLSARLVLSSPVVPRSSRLWPEPNEEYMRIYRENEAEDFLEEEQLIVGPVTIFDHDEWIRIANEIDQAAGTRITILVYGLKDVGIGMRRLTLTSLNLGVLEEAVFGLWPHFDALAKEVHLVYPQPIQNEGNQIAVILEFYDLWNPRDGFWKPILHECLQPELDTIERTACYSPEQVTKETFPIPRDLCPTANVERELHVWVRGHPLLPYIERGVFDGDLVTIRYMSPSAPIEDWIKRLFPGADDFKRAMIERTAYHEMTPTTWTFLGEVSPGEPTCLDVHHPQWLRFHDPYFIVQAFLEIVTNRGFRYNDKTIYVTPSGNDKNVTFVFGSPQVNQALVQVGFSAKWDESWSERFCYAVHGNQAMETFLQHINVYNFDVSVFQDGRLLDSDHIHLTNGDSIEIEIHDDPEDHDSSEDDSASLMQRPQPSSAPGFAKVHLAGLHLPLTEVLINTEVPMMESVSDFWPYPRFAHSSVIAFHPVSDPPSFAHADQLPMYLAERNDDRFEQEMENDVMAVVTVSVQAEQATQPRSQRFKVLWVPSRGTRANYIDFFRMTGHCRKPKVLCFLYINNLIWPETDTALRNVQSGDHLRLQVRAEGSGWCDYEYSEGISRSRRLFASSDSEREEARREEEEEPGEFEEQEEERSPLSEYTIRTADAGRGSTPRSRSPSRPHRENLENEHESPSLLQTTSKRRNTPQDKAPSLNFPHEGKPHVSDRWCAQPRVDFVDSRRPLQDITNVPFIEPQLCNVTGQDDIDQSRIAPTCMPRRMPIALGPHLSLPLQADVAVPSNIQSSDIALLLAQWQFVEPGQFANDQQTLEMMPELKENILAASIGPPLEHFHLFTDGSYSSDLGQASWSVVVVTMDSEHYTPSTTCRLFGYYTGMVSDKYNDDCWHGAPHLNAYIAELEALFHAHWWAICHQIPQVHVHYDAMSAGQAAAGTWGFSSKNSLAIATRSLAQALDEVARRSTTYHHIRAHSGDRWNELADATAKAALTGDIVTNCPASYKWHEWLTGQSQLKIESLPTRLAFLRGDLTLPTGTNQGLTWPALLAEPSTDALWAIGVPTTPKLDPEHVTQTTIKCCTYNVRTLKEDPIGLTPGGCEFLRAQFAYYQYQIVALQETRARTSMVCDTPDYIRIISASNGGHYGCELWFSKIHPIFGGEKCTLQHITVVHQDPSLLAVRLRLGNQFLVVISAHAPHSGKSQQQRDAWWNQLEQLLQRFHDRGSILLLGDLNAQIGSEFAPHVGQLTDKTTTPNGHATVNLAQRFGLWLPSTFDDIHEGPSGTWKHPGTKEAIRLDYHLLDQRLRVGYARTWVDYGLETPQQGEDHHALALEFTLIHQQGKKSSHHSKIDEVAIRDPANHSEIGSILNQAIPQEWATNAHDHYARWAKDLHDRLIARFPQKRQRPRKHYISEQTWAIRASKITVRKVLRTATADFPDQCPALAEQLRILSKQLKDSLKKDRNYHIDSLLQDVDRIPHSQLFAQLRRLGIGSRLRKSGPRALPMMRKEDGSLAADQSEAQEVWRRYAATLEAGTITSPQGLLDQCHRRQCQHLATAPKPNAFNIPTLVQLERSCRRIQPFKARGPDGLPGSIFHCFPQQMARHMRPLLYKMLCNFNEPIGFKGGRLIHLYKGKGDAALPQNRRGILISNHASKVAHNALRPCYMATLESSMLPMQLGGRPKKSVQQAAHVLRLFMSACRQSGRSCGIIFLDIKTAYYQVVREVVAKAAQPQDFLDEITATFDLPPNAMTALRTHIDAEAASRQLGLCEFLEHLLAELHSSTWFSVDQSDQVTETRLGTRPGSCFADVLFNILFAKILGGVRNELAEAGVLTELQWSGQRGILSVPAEEPNSATALLAEAIWADDLALFIHHSEPAKLVENLQVTCGILFNSCLNHGLRPNFERGKTEILASLRGGGAIALRRHWFTEQGGVLPIPTCHLEGCSVKLVARYRHLGGLVNARGTAKCEVVARVGQMKATFRKHRGYRWKNAVHYFDLLC